MKEQLGGIRVGRIKFTSLQARLFCFAEFTLLPVRPAEHDPGVGRLFFELSRSIRLLNRFGGIAELNVDRRDSEQWVRFPRAQFHSLLEFLERSTIKMKA